MKTQNDRGQTLDITTDDFNLLSEHWTDLLEMMAKVGQQLTEYGQALTGICESMKQTAAQDDPLAERCQCGHVKADHKAHSHWTYCTDPDCPCQEYREPESH